MDDLLFVDGLLLFNRLNLLNIVLIVTIFPLVHSLYIKRLFLSTLFGVMIGVTLR
jgi:hypothetical protein